MKLHKVLIVNGMARSRTEAEQLIKTGSVSVGGCYPDCTFFQDSTYTHCTCGGWEKETNPVAEIPAGVKVKIKNGMYRLVPRKNKEGYDQLKGIGESIES